MKIKIPLFLVSASVIAYQLLLLHNLSITQWHHFASMIISVALLGFGASGTLLTVFRKRILADKDFYYSLFILLSALMMLVSFRLSQHQNISFDSYLIFSSRNDMLKLLVTYLLFFLPFLFAASAIGLLFTAYPEKIGNLYFINLFGSAAGGGVILILLNYLTPQNALALIIFLPVIAAMISLSNKKGWILVSFLVILSVFNLLKPTQLYLSEFKSLSKVMNLPQSEIVAEKTSPYGLLQIVESPYIRYAPGLSLNYTGESGINNVIFNNGNWIGPIFEAHREYSFFDYSTLSLPFIIGENRKILVLEAGSGEAVQMSLRYGANDITALESNSAIVDFVQRDFPSSTYNHQSVTVLKQDSYAYLLGTYDKYDLIHLPLYDAFGGAAGIGAIEEKPLLSQESFNRMWHCLSEEGMLSISTWIDTPLRYPLRITATLYEMLVNQNVNDHQQHLIAIRNWSMITFAVSKSPINGDALNRISAFCSEMGFDLLLFPGIDEEQRERYNLLTDKSLLEYIDVIVSPQGESFISNYQFNIKPISEDRPYPFQYLRLTKFNELMKQYTVFDLPYLEIGYLLLLLTFIIATLLSSLFIISPLIFTTKMGTDKLRTFIYFFALGLGFMMVEIVLIQKFIVYLGTPLYSSAVVISVVLLFSGLGSNYSSKLLKVFDNKWHSENNILLTARVVLILIVLLILLFTWVLNSILLMTINLPLFFKLSVTVLIIAPLSFLMGFPFPLGISYIHHKGNNNNLTWAWGINGSISVISSLLAAIIAIGYGFTAVKILAAGCYFLALLSVFDYHTLKRLR